MSRKKKTLIALNVLFYCCLISLLYYVNDYKHWTDLSRGVHGLLLYGSLVLSLLTGLYIKYYKPKQNAP